MLALLVLEAPRAPGVLYVDADVWFPDAARRSCCLPEAYAALGRESGADLVGGGNQWARPNGVWLNSGLRHSVDASVSKLRIGSGFKGKYIETAIWQSWYRSFGSQSPNFGSVARRADGGGCADGAGCGSPR